MNLLVIEDDSDKQIEIVSFIKENFNDINVEMADSVMSGIKMVKKNPGSKVLLDMSLPLYGLSGINNESNEFEAFGGFEVLDEIKRCRLNLEVVVFTAFDVLEDEYRRLNLEELDSYMKGEYQDYYRGCIHYDQSSLEWRSTLRIICDEWRRIE